LNEKLIAVGERKVSLANGVDGEPAEQSSDKYGYGSNLNSAQCGCASSRRSMSRNARSERLSLL
jgi:hypothetical protein